MAARIKADIHFNEHTHTFQDYRVISFKNRTVLQTPINTALIRNERDEIEKTD